MGDSIVELLRTLPLAQQFSDDLLEELARLAELRRLRQREQFVHEGAEVLGIYVVRTGAVLLETRAGAEQARIVHQLLPGDSLGDLLVLEGIDVYPFNATATEPGTEVLLFQREPFLEVWSKQPEFPKLLVRALSQKVKMLYGRVMSLLVASATTRLARYVLERPRDASGSFPEIDLGLDRRDLAALLAITPEHLSRILRRWTEAEIIFPIGREIELHKLEVLTAIADLEEPAES